MTCIKKEKCYRCNRLKKHGIYGYEHGWWCFKGYLGSDGKTHNGSYCATCSNKVL